MLIDTGSAVTLISEKIFNNLGLGNSDLSELSSILTTADGETMSVLGQITVKITIGGKTYNHPVVVAELGDISGILGLDFMSENEIVIDTSKGTLRSPEFLVQLRSRTDNQTSCARVHISKTVHVPARSEMVIRGKIDGAGISCDEGILVLEPLNGFNGDKDVYIPNSSVRKTESGITFSVLNPTMNTVILKKNAAVARLQSFQEVQQSNVARISRVIDNR